MQSHPNGPDSPAIDVSVETPDSNVQVQELGSAVRRGRVGIRGILAIIAVLGGETTSLEARAEPSSVSASCQVYQGPKGDFGWVLKKGRCKDGLAEGYGEATSRSGDAYAGGYRQGKRHGKGTLLRSDGSKYTGEWQNDELHGKGSYTFASGGKYVGQWQNTKIHGQGSYTFADGKKYVGEYKDNMRNGQGTYTWPGGQKYVGQWQNDLIHGQGTFYYVNGMVFTGEFKDDKRVDANGTWSFSHPKYKTPNAMYVYAGQLEVAGNSSGANVVYNHIIKTFPDSPVAVQATDRLRQIREAAIAAQAQAAALAAQSQIAAQAQAATAEQVEAYENQARIRQVEDRRRACQNTYQTEFARCASLPERRYAGEGIGSTKYEYPQDDCRRSVSRAYEKCQ